MHDSGIIPRGVDAIYVDPQRYLDLGTWHRTAAWLRRNDPVHRVETEGFKAFLRNNAPSGHHRDRALARKIPEHDATSPAVAAGSGSDT